MATNKRLKVQIIILMVVFYLITVVIGGFAVYRSGTATYLRAKNDMIQRDLERMIAYNHVFTNYNNWFYDYCRGHYEEILNTPYTADPDVLDEIVRVENSEDPDDAIPAASNEAQLMIAKQMYTELMYQMSYELKTNNYENMYLMDIVEGDLGFIYCDAKGISDDIDDDLSSGALGSRRDYDLKSHPAIEHIVSGVYDNVEFEQFSHKGSNPENLYIGYMPIFADGQVRAVLCLEYNWDSFRTDLIQNMRLVAAIMLVGMIVCYMIVIFVLNRIAIRPIGELKSAVAEYRETKDGSKAAERISRIKPRNEIEELSENVGEMMTELDDYIGEIKELTVEVMEALAHTIDAKDKYTIGHSTRVAQYSRMIAEKMGLSEEEQQRIYNMGLLHDIGKIGVPSSIINKPSRLTDEEFAIIKTHPTLGYEILSEIKSRPDLAVGALYHHERYDGRGYPNGTAGEEIPFEARMIAVADSYDAMTSNRSYRAYLPQEVVRSEIEKNIGTQFDPEAAKAMLTIIDEDKEYLLHE